LIEKKLSKVINKIMAKNKIIVTGGAGFVGTNLINFLLKKKLLSSKF